MHAVVAAHNVQDSPPVAPVLLCAVLLYTANSKLGANCCWCHQTKEMTHLNGSPRILIVLLSVPMTAMGAAAEASAAP
jgi:hypothetical protein